LVLFVFDIEAWIGVEQKVSDFFVTTLRLGSLFLKTSALLQTTDYQTAAFYIL